MASPGPRKLLLRCRLSLGDIVVLTAAVRDLHRCYPGAFLTDVRTTCSEVWYHNPHLTQLDESDPAVESIDCEYPLIEWSNQFPYHFLHGFIDHLNARLGLEIRATDFRGDIHLSPQERRRGPSVAQLLGLSRQREIPYWLVLAGGKHDLTIKWWEMERYQRVVDHFRGRIQFVQLGATGHFHPRLHGTIDLRGATNIRDLIGWVHRAQGVLCGVTGLMHLAAAVPLPEGAKGPRPCVVVAGGREPVHWEEYPGHAFLHTVGRLDCCASGGCWRSRAVPLGDGDPRDRAPNLCVNLQGSLPRCMDQITADQVIATIEQYLAGRKLPTLRAGWARKHAHRVEQTTQASFEDLPLTPSNARPMLERRIQQLSAVPLRLHGRGIVICAGGLRFFTCAYVAIRRLRRSGCRLPVELWYLGPQEMTPSMKRMLRPYGVRCIDALAHGGRSELRRVGGWELKPHAIRHSRFREVLLLDADNVVVRNPEFLFETEEYRRYGAIFWPDLPGSDVDPKALRLCGLSPSQAGDRPFETGQLVIDKRRCWKALELTCWFNQHSDLFYPLTHGDKETFRLAFHLLKQPYAMPSRNPAGEMGQYDFSGRLLFQHRNTDKWSLVFPPRRVPGFRFEQECRGYLRELRSRWKFVSRPSKVNRAMGSSSNALDPQPSWTFPDLPGESRLRANSRDHGGRSTPARSKMSFTLVTLCDDAMRSVGELTEAAWREYAKRHGYRFVAHSTAIDRERHPAWSKILAVEAQLREEGGIVMWVDADTFPMNFEFPAHTLLPSRREVAFASDFNGLNSGVFLIRSSDWSLGFLKTVYWLKDVARDPDGFGEKWEQNTIKAVLDQFQAASGKVAILPERAMNSSVASFHPGDFLLHLGGMTNAQRLHHLRHARRWVIR